MNRLAVYGWSDSTPRVLEALRAHAALEAVAVGDQRPAALVRARLATGLPGFQHVREMVRAVAFDAVLIGGGEYATEVAEGAAARGADLILIGARADAETLARSALAAQRHGVRMSVLRPWLRNAHAAFSIERLHTEAPDLLVVEVTEPRAPAGMLRDLVAFVARAMGERCIDVSATRAGDDFEGSPVAAHLRLAGGRSAVLIARMALAPSLRVLATSAQDTRELRFRDGAVVVAQGFAATEPAGEQIALPRLGASELAGLEAARVAAGDALDLALAPAEAATLAAVERALEGAFAETVSAAPRPFQVLRGGGHATPRPLTGVSGLSLVNR